MKKPFFSVFIPTYNRSHIVKSAIDSVLGQTFTDYELIVRNNGSVDDTAKIIKKIINPKLKFIDSPTNCLYDGNLREGAKISRGKYFFILADDDLIDKNTLKLYHQALTRFPQAGAITRPYYWFENNYKKAIRLKQTTTQNTDILVDLNSPWSDIKLVLSSLDQLSGLCFKKSLMKTDFDKEHWISHAYPWLDIFKNHPVIFIKKYILAVRIGNSGTRSNVYQKSPMIFWKNMINRIFHEKKFKKIKEKIISDFIGINYVGLMQIRNYGTFYSYLREVKNLIVFRKKNLLNPKFYLWVFLTLFTPPFILRKLNDYFKNHIYHQIISPSILIKL